jgi:hypothetical protein
MTVSTMIVGTMIASQILNAGFIASASVWRR